jgi:hypothetical protein
MQYLILIYADETNFPDRMDAEHPPVSPAYTSYIQALKNAGVLAGLNRLRPSSCATTVKVTNGKSQVLDGPYAESKEQLAGYFLIDVADLDAALTWAARCPGATDGTVEVRPIWEINAGQGAAEHRLTA